MPAAQESMMASQEAATLQTGDSFYPCKDLLHAAEEELGAFFEAVYRSFGPEEALQASEDWLQELAFWNGPVKAKVPVRQITIAAADRLASRINSRQ